jgi:hypothetical protein
MSLEDQTKQYIKDEFKRIIDNTCYNSGTLSNVKTCKISEEKINNISYFLSHKLPKCDKLKINLNSVRNGKLISRGAFGYSFLVTNTDNKKIIIKIILCEKTINYLPDGASSEEKKNLLMKK